MSIPRVVRSLRREGWTENDIENVVWKNPIRYWGQSGRLVETV